MQNKPLRWPASLLFAAAAAVFFHLAYLFDFCHWCIVLFLYCLFRLAGLATARRALWIGMAVGLAAYSPHLAFFWTLFDSGAIALWCILSFWLALFLVAGRACLVRFGPVVWAVAAPFLWTGLEFFRSELYHLRFAWLNAGYVFSSSSALPFLAGLGVYGIGFLLMAWAAFAGVAAQLSRPARLAVAMALAAISILPFWLPAGAGLGGKAIHVAGVQLEDSSPMQTRTALDVLLKKFPGTELFVLSENAFDGPVPPEICAWCKEHGRWLAAGGKDPISPVEYYNTAFVVGQDGAVAFRQAKCVPVQLMKDGLPARQQCVWDSPWGKLGFGICYDASYTVVTDELIRQGAQALIFPTMDYEDWGKAEHEMHSRIAPMRAAEYEVPVFRVCSSGISQAVDGRGRVIATAPYPGPGAMLAAQLQLPARGRMPPDRWLAPLAAAAAAGLMLFLIVDAARRIRRPR